MAHPQRDGGRASAASEATGIEAVWTKAKNFFHRQREFATEVVLATTEKTERHSASDFEPGDFKKKEFDDEKWREAPGVGEVRRGLDVVLRAGRRRERVAEAAARRGPDRGALARGQLQEQDRRPDLRPRLHGAAHVPGDRAPAERHRDVQARELRRAEGARDPRRGRAGHLRRPEPRDLLVHRQGADPLSLQARGHHQVVGLGDRALDDHRPPLGVPAEPRADQAHGRDAQAQAGDGRDQQEVQRRHDPARGRDAGALPQARDESVQLRDRLPADDPPAPGLVGALYGAPDRGRALSHAVLVVYGPVGAGQILHHPVRARRRRASSSRR